MLLLRDGAVLPHPHHVPGLNVPLDDPQHLHPAVGPGVPCPIFHPQVRPGVILILGVALSRPGADVLLRGDDQHRFGRRQEHGIVVLNAVDVLRVPLLRIKAAVILLQGRGDLAVIPLLAAISADGQSGEGQGQAQDGQEHPQKLCMFSFFHGTCLLSGLSVQFDVALKSRGCPSILRIAQESMCRFICFDEAFYRLHNTPVIR